MPDRIAKLLLVSYGINSFLFSFYYAPNFEEVEGAYWFDPVRLSICPLRFLADTLA